MLHRIFFAVNLPEKIKENLAGWQDELAGRFGEIEPVRWTEKYNLHLTLLFLGSAANDELMKIIKASEQESKNHPAFELKLNKIAYGPPKNNPPKMVWAIGEKSEPLAKLKNGLEKALFKSETDSPALENRGLYPHITLGRIKSWQFKRIEPEERPEINEDICLEFSVNSFELMESELGRNGPKYSQLSSFPLK